MKSKHIEETDLFDRCLYDSLHDKLNTRCSITSTVGSSMLAWLGQAAISADRLFTVDDKHIKIVLRSFWRLIKQTTV